MKAAVAGLVPCADSGTSTTTGASPRSPAANALAITIAARGEPGVVLERLVHGEPDEEAERGNIYMQFGSEEFYEMVERKLQDPDYRMFRTDAAFNGVLGFGG